VDFDFVVIGSGFGGSVAAHRLTEKGYRVAVMEMGRRWRPEAASGSASRQVSFCWQETARARVPWPA